MTANDPGEGMDLAKEIERLANAYFSGNALPDAGRVGPNASHVGAGGASPAVTLPPVPGPMHRPPLAAAPPPKESDLRAIPTLLSENFGTPSVIALASSVPAETSTPYFLELAGLPASAPPVNGAPPVNAPPGGAPPFNGAAPVNASPGGGLPINASPGGGLPINASPGGGLPVNASPGGGLPVNAASAVGAPSRETWSLDHFFSPEVVPSLPASRGIFDPHAVRRDFPILRETVHGRRLVWLDNAATTQKPQAVIDRLAHFYAHENSNVHRAAHELAARATDAYEGARDRVSRFLKSPSSKQIVWVRGTTEAINLVAQSWGRRNVGPGDEIVITWLEHHANIVPWQQLASEKGARLRVAPVDDRGQVILEQYERLLGPRTRIVSFTQVSNALGTITPAREMVAMAHRHGARVLVDGAQAVSHMPVDVQDLDCDFYCFSGHKVFGPTGIGALYGKADVLEAMPPWQGGGNMIADVTFEKTSYNPPPTRFEAGTGNIADAVGLGAALDYLSAIGVENVNRYEHELLEYATEQLQCVPGLTMIGLAPDRAGVLSFVLDGVRTEDVSALLDEEGIAVRSGHHCAQPILRRFGLESTVRASLALYNTREDVDALVAALKRLQTGRPPR
ncbi:MAG TPA: family 2A encapsulin nanocompartment cargo protein cysteine desulfurase [Polyangiaceae bacterium]|nr:family 2A encapsulin nanocompartment cargo protein cysteine desulfurase [Polyangiaceae bacterium]